MTILNDLINGHGANAYVYMDSGYGAGFGEKGVLMYYDERAIREYGDIDLREIPNDETFRTEDGTEFRYISDWIECLSGYKFRIGF